MPRESFIYHFRILILHAIVSIARRNTAKISTSSTSITQSIAKLNGMGNYKTWVRRVRIIMAKEASLEAIQYRLRLKEGKDVKNLTDRAKKLYEKLLAAEQPKEKDLVSSEAKDLNLPTIESIISGARRN